MFPYFYDWHRRTDIPLSTPVESRGSILADTDLVAAVVPLLALGKATAVHHTHSTCGTLRDLVTSYEQLILKKKKRKKKEEQEEEEEGEGGGGGGEGGEGREKRRR